MRGSSPAPGAPPDSFSRAGIEAGRAEAAGASRIRAAVHSPSPLSIPYLPEQRPHASCRTLHTGSFPKELIELISALQEREELGVRGESRTQSGRGQLSTCFPGVRCSRSQSSALKTSPKIIIHPLSSKPPAAAGAPPEKRHVFEVSMI